MTVLEALSPVQGEFRVRDFRVIAGEPKTETVHREYGCQYEIDLARVYFTQRLATERKRIADQVGSGDVVVDMFAGAGPFSILAAKSAREVVAIDKNPVATLYLERNARLNRFWTGGSLSRTRRISTMSCWTWRCAGDDTQKEIGGHERTLLYR